MCDCSEISSKILHLIGSKSHTKFSQKSLEQRGKKYKYKCVYCRNTHLFYFEKVENNIHVKIIYNKYNILESQKFYCTRDDIFLNEIFLKFINTECNVLIENIYYDSNIPCIPPTVNKKFLFKKL